MIYKNERPAVLVLQDGTVFEGIGFGSTKKVSGELTFCSIPGAGYIESLTDPAFQGKMVNFTYPSIGNYGVPAKKKDEFGIIEQFESQEIHPAGIIVNEYCDKPSHYESIKTLEDWLIEEDIPGIQWVDTRVITQRLVQEESMFGLINVAESGQDLDLEKLKQEIQDKSLNLDENLVKRVSTDDKIKYKVKDPRGKVVILDLGIKNNIIRTLLSRNLDVIVVPYLYNYKKIMELQPDGIIFPNGPGNPSIYESPIELANQLIKESFPTMGIGLGTSVLGLAAGGKVYKMTAEHRGGRTTVETATGQCYITFQNHDYCLEQGDINEFTGFFHDKDDESNEGIIHEEKPIFGVNFNPEASPGALDMRKLIFDKFLDFLEVKK
ncbi:MAG: glutamine-hydrolyzing carbamoyl-phosphate synthase small subunit [Promethearchaeia archaeon]